MSKEHAMHLSVFLLFRFLSKDLIIAALTAYFIRGIIALYATLPPSIKRFLTKEWNYKEVVSLTPLIHTVSVDFIKSRVVASAPGFFICMWYAAKKNRLANRVLGISSRIQGIRMLSLGLFKTGAILLLLFPTADTAWRSSMLTVGDTLIRGLFVALALRIAVPRGSKNRFFNCAFLRYTVGLTVIIIIMNWFRAARPTLLYVAPGVIGFVVVHCLWNGEVKQEDGTNELMGKVWDWNIYGTKLKFDGWVLRTANKDGDGGEDDAAALPEDCGGGSEDGDSGVDNVTAPSEDHDGGQDVRGSASEDSDDEIVPCGLRAVQLLAICANFPILAINGYDWQQGRCIYRQPEGEVQEEGMVDLVPIGPRGILMAYGAFILKVFYSTTTAGDEESISGAWDVAEDDEVEEYTQTICRGPDCKLEITYLVIPNAIQTNIEVRLKLKDLGSRNRAVYGKIKASAIDYGNKSVHLFNCARGRSWSVPSGSTSTLPLSLSVIALPYHRKLEFHIDVDLTVITACDNKEEEKTVITTCDNKEEKNLKFSLEFSRGIRSQEREVDDDQVEVSITFDPPCLP